MSRTVRVNWSLRNKSPNALLRSKTCMQQRSTDFQKSQKQPRTSIQINHRANFNHTGDQATRQPGDQAIRRSGDQATRRPGNQATRRPGFEPFLASPHLDLIIKLRTCGHLVGSPYGLYMNRGQRKRWAQPYMRVWLEPFVNLHSLTKCSFS
jgi:hypothetical protein